MSKKFPLGLFIFIAIVLLVVGYVFVTIHNFINAYHWTLYTNVPQEKKELYCNVARMPELSGLVERYGVRGTRDCEYIIQTYSYATVDQLCASLPSGCERGVRTALNTEPEVTQDIDEKTVSKYQITTMLPLIDKDKIDEKYKYQYIGAFISYYVLKSEDGTYRFAIQIMDT